jgi:hypothetical protein
MLGNVLPDDTMLFLAYSRYVVLGSPVGVFVLIHHCSEGNSTSVRMAAFDGLFLRPWHRRQSMWRYFLAVMTRDSSRLIRRHVSRCAWESLAILASISEINNASKRNEPLLIEEDVSQPSKFRSKRTETDLLIKSLRRDVGKALGVQGNLIMSLML